MNRFEEFKQRIENSKSHTANFQIYDEMMHCTEEELTPKQFAELEDILNNFEIKR
jgi:hypothetical protein